MVKRTVPGATSTDVVEEHSLYLWRAPEE